MKKRLLEATLATLVMMTPGLALDNRSAQTSDEGPPTVTVPAYASAPKQLARFWSASTKAPLVVDLHQWSTDQSGFNGDDVRFDLEVRKLGWNFLRPALTGQNNNPHACCSTEVLMGFWLPSSSPKRKARSISPPFMSSAYRAEVTPLCAPTCLAKCTPAS